MPELLVLVICVAVFALIAFAAWVIARISRLSDDLRRTRAGLDALREQGRSDAKSAQVPVADAKSAVAVIPPPVPAPVAFQPPPVAPQSRAVPPPIPAASVQAPPPQVRPVSVTPPPVIVSPPPVPQLPPRVEPASFAPPPAQSSVSEHDSAKPFSWEIFMGTKFLAWVGGFAAFLAVAYFLKYSFDHEWISPTVQAAAGFLFGAGVVVGGLVMARKGYEITAHTLCAVGVLCLYGVTFACRAYYNFPFFDVIPTFALMALITVAAFVLAVRLNGRYVAVLGIFGGFLTPILLSTGVDNPVGLFSYIALLDVGLYAVALHRRWNFLVPFGAVGTALMQIGWAFAFLGNNNTSVAMLVCLVFVVLFLAGFVVARRLGRVADVHVGCIVALVFVSFGFAFYLSVESIEGLRPWVLFGFVFLVDACALAVAALEKRASWIPPLTGLAIFVLLAVWSGKVVWVYDHLLIWALVCYFIFAVLHAAFPLVLARLRGVSAASAGGLGELFAPLALVLVMVPLFKDSSATFAVWPAILLLDLLAIVIAACVRSIGGVVAALVFTLFTAAIWIFKIPVELPQVPLSLLLIIGGFAVLFFAASLWLGRKLTAQGAGGATVYNFSTVLPALSSLLPFVLIVMVESRLQIANPTPIFGLGLLLAVMALGLANILKHEWLPACALVGVLAICYVWNQNIFYVAYGLDGTLRVAGLTGDRVSPFVVVGLGWIIGFFALFAAYPFSFRRIFENMRGPWVSAAAAGPLFFPLVYFMVRSFWPNHVMGLLPAAFAVPAVASLVAVMRLDSVGHPRREGRMALFGGVALLFITAIFPIQWGREILTISWALEGAALLWLYRRVPHRALPWVGFGLLAVVFVRLVLNPAVLSYHVRGDAPIFNWYLYTYGVAILCFLAGAILLKGAPAARASVAAPLASLARVLTAGCVFLAFLLLNIEIADFFTEPGSQVLALEFSGNFARDMSYTIAWALFALALLVVGIWKGLRGARYAVLGLLGVVALKLIFHDLASLETLYRVAALFAVAVIMILASFLYQKFIAPRESVMQKSSQPPPPLP